MTLVKIFVALWYTAVMGLYIFLILVVSSYGGGASALSDQVFVLLWLCVPILGAIGIWGLMVPSLSPRSYFIMRILCFIPLLPVIGFVLLLLYV